MQTASDALVTIASLELAGHGAVRFSRHLTPYVTDILQARCRQEGFPPGTANHAELVYLRMATHATWSVDPESRRNILVNTVSLNRMRDLLNGTAKETIRKAVVLLELTGIIRPVSEDALTDLARRHRAMAYEVEPDSLQEAHGTLQTRSPIRRWEPSTPSSPRKREILPETCESAGNDFPEAGNGCLHPDSQTSGIQKDHHDSFSNVESIPVDVADADGLSAFLEQNTEIQDRRVTEADIPAIGRIFESSAPPGPELTLSALPRPLRQHPWTWRAMTHLLRDMATMTRLSRPAGYFIEQLKMRAVLDRLDHRPLSRPAPTTRREPERMVPPPVREDRTPEITPEQQAMALQRLAEQRPDLDPEKLARDLLADNYVVRSRGWESPMARLFLERTAYEVCRQVTASMDLPPFQAMERQVAARMAGV